MKGPHGKAVAKHSNPESCAGGGNIGEAGSDRHLTL